MVWTIAAGILVAAIPGCLIGFGLSMTDAAFKEGRSPGPSLSIVLAGILVGVAIIGIGFFS